MAQRKIGVLALKDLSGKKHTLEQVKDDRLVVFAFIGTECPLAKLYAPRLQKLYETYHRSGVAFFAVSSNCQDSVLELNGYAKRHDIRFPVLKDVGNKFADEIGATRTPQVFVLDERRAIRYHGRIDDQYGVGY
ncbi:MAG: redoxin domain-containing protein [Pirellulales bacterium]|nr:redoxin domain-containing protein [Pirellulales bacterium]